MDRSVAVVGGGLAGLTAALYAARDGAVVTAYERVSEAGGRARTRDASGFRFNLGPHALYRQAEGAEVLADLDLEPDGAVPPLAGAGARRGGRLHALPSGFVTLLTTGLLRPAEKLEAARFLAALPRLDPSRFADHSLAEVLASELRHERVRELAAALVRLSSYAHAPTLHGGDAALAQLQRAFSGGVLYLHGGWQRLVAALERRAADLGVRIHLGAAVRGVRAVPGGFAVEGPEGDAGRRYDAVVLAVPPAECERLLAGEGAAHAAVRSAVASLVPVRAASLELGLSRLPRPRCGFVLGIDEPTYFSVHSSTARLAPEGGALIHCTRYLAPDEAPARDVLEKELEAVVDQAQPGWRDAVVERSLAGDLTVAHTLAPRGGLAARPGVCLPGTPGLYLAGDWVGSEGMLADAAFASGRAAGRAAASSGKTASSGETASSGKTASSGETGGAA